MLSDVGNLMGWCDSARALGRRAAKCCHRFRYLWLMLLVLWVLEFTCFGNVEPNIKHPPLCTMRSMRQAACSFSRAAASTGVITANGSLCSISSTTCACNICAPWLAKATAGSACASSTASSLRESYFLAGKPTIDRDAVNGYLGVWVARLELSDAPRCQGTVNIRASEELQRNQICLYGADELGRNVSEAIAHVKCLEFDACLGNVGGQGLLIALPGSSAVVVILRL